MYAGHINTYSQLSMALNFRLDNIFVIRDSLSFVEGLNSLFVEYSMNLLSSDRSAVSIERKVLKRSKSISS